MDPEYDRDMKDQKRDRFGQLLFGTDVETCRSIPSFGDYGVVDKDLESDWEVEHSVEPSQLRPTSAQIAKST